MKRWLAYLAAFALLAFTADRGTDIGKLMPVEVVWLAMENGQVYLQTDTGDMGRGADVETALQDMKASALGTIFLDTADYLIVAEGSEALLSQMYDILRPSCMVCVASQMPPMDRVAAFLTTHEPGVTLRSYRVVQNPLPKLEMDEGRYQWRGA